MARLHSVPDRCFEGADELVAGGELLLQIAAANPAERFTKRAVAEPAHQGGAEEVDTGFK